MYTRNGVGIQIAEFDNSIVICVPKVKAAIEGHWKDVLGRPLEQIEIEVVLKIRGV